MKRSLFLITLFCSAVLANAQVARWLIPPLYNAIDLVPGDVELLLADSADTKILFSQNGRRLTSTSDVLHRFQERHAITTRLGTAQITAIYDEFGHKTPVEGYQVGAGYPCFVNGYMLVFDGQYYCYMGTDGQVSPDQFNNAYPFSNGYASCFRYQNQRKMKDPIYMLLNDQLAPVPLRWENKTLAADDVEFISSVNDESIGVIVAKGKVFFFNGQTKALSPVFASADETNTKNQAKLNGSFQEHYMSVGDSVYVLNARCGRNGNVEITFSQQLVPISISRNGELYTYTKRVIEQQSYSTNLKRIKGADDKIALYWDSEMILPPQFNKVWRCYGDKAIVQPVDKWGLLRIFPNEHFVLSLNGGNGIAFRHRTFDTTLRLDMPSYVHSSLTSLDVSGDGLTIDKARKEGRDTPEGNFIEYPCVLNIPSDISSEEKHNYTFPIQVLYEGLRSTELKLTTQAWHYNYYTVNANESEAVVTQGTLSVNFDVTVDRRLGDLDYSKTFDLKTDSLTYEIEQVSESRYKCKIFGLREGTNTFYAVITEEGCPPLLYQFEVEYIRPVERSSRPTRATIRRRTPRPVLDY